LSDGIDERPQPAGKLRGGEEGERDEVLVQPAKSQKGVTPPANEWQIDHVTAKDNGGTNSFGNAQVLSRAENRAKSNK
jgi:5-methylcytosine-specific restriction endonuclease McrA